MENFNGNSLKAAVKVYGPLHSDGKTEAEIKEAIGKDERGFTADQIDKIYDAILNPEPAKPKAYKHIVKKAFRDIDDFSVEHEEGKDVSDFNPKRLATLVANGIVEKVEVED